MGAIRLVGYFLATSLLLGRSSPATPCQQALSVGESVDVALEEGDRDPDGVYRRSYHCAVGGPGTLFVRAESETMDPTLVCGERSGLEPTRSTGQGGKISAFVILELASARDYEVEVVLEASRPGIIRLALSNCRETPRGATAVGEAEALLEWYDDQHRASDRAEWRTALAEAGAMILGLDPDEMSWPVRSLTERIGKEAYEEGLLSLAYDARLRVLEHLEQHYPERDDRLQQCQLDFARFCDLIGRPGSGIAPLQRAYAALDAAPPADEEFSFAVVERLCIHLSKIGRIQEARGNIEPFMRRLERSSHPRAPQYLRSAKSNLAVTLYQMGDLAGAQTCYEELLAIKPELPLERRLKVQGNLAMTLAGMGQVERAAALQRTVLEGFESLHAPDLDRARANLAASLTVLGRAEQALALFEQVLERESLGPDDPLRLLVRFEIGLGRMASGDLPGARELVQDVLVRRQRVLTPDHPHLHETRLVLAQILFRMGETAALEQEMRLILPTLQGRIDSAAGLGRRERSELARQVAGSLRDLYILASATEGVHQLERQLFGITESLRALSALSPRIPDAIELDPELRSLREAWRAASTRLVDRGNAQSAEQGLSETAQETAIAERAFRQGLAQRGWLHSPTVTVEEVARSLPEKSAAVSYRRLARSGEPLLRAGLSRAEDELIAHVVLPDDHHRLILIGSMREVDELVAAWRAAVGRPLEGAPGGGDPSAEATIGRALRALVLDPVIEAADGAEELRLCLDDSLHLVPLDALPAADQGGEVMADRMRLRVLPSLVGEVAAPLPPTSPRWVGVGALDYGEPEGGAPRSFEPLPSTGDEVRTIAALLSERKECPVTLLLGPSATPERVRLAAESASILHVATHGFSAGERVLTWDGPMAGGMAHQDPSFAVTGLAPLAACGLALSGANGSRKALVTGEELATWDLSGLDLALLSACETGVGLRRSGQGVASLQAALHAAGARTVIASLWRVDDESAARMLRTFYEFLLSESGNPGEALARAKRAQRSERRPTRDWAGWLLTSASGSR